MSRLILSLRTSRTRIIGLAMAVVCGAASPASAAPAEGPLLENGAGIDGSNGSSSARFAGFACSPGQSVDEAQRIRSVRVRELWILPSASRLRDLCRCVSSLPVKSPREYLRIAHGPDGRAVHLTNRGRGSAPISYLVEYSELDSTVFESPRRSRHRCAACWVDREGILWTRIEGGEGCLFQKEIWFWRLDPFDLPLPNRLLELPERPPPQILDFPMG